MCICVYWAWCQIMNQNIYTNLAGLSSHLDGWERLQEIVWLSWLWRVGLSICSISNIEFGELRSPPDILSRECVSNCLMWRKEAVSTRLGQGGVHQNTQNRGRHGESYHLPGRMLAVERIKGRQKNSEEHQWARVPVRRGDKGTRLRKKWGPIIIWWMFREMEHPYSYVGQKARKLNSGGTLVGAIPGK